MLFTVPAADRTTVITDCPAQHPNCRIRELIDRFTALDNADWPDDEDEEEFFDDCRRAYCSAVAKLDSVGMNIDEIASRYNNARREIILNRDEYVIKAFRRVPDEFWIGEDWESEFRSIYFSSIYNG